jgi:hypothetical protein
MECRPLAESSPIFSSRGKRGRRREGEREGRVHSGEGERGTELFGFFSLFLAKAHFTSFTCPFSPFIFKDLKEGRKEGRKKGWMDEWNFFSFSFGPFILEEC